jgi:hypothetical protein
VSAADLLIPTVTAATLARSGHANQDRYLVLPNAIAVLDGATNPDEPEGGNGGWYAGELLAALAPRLARDTQLPLVDVLRDAIAETADRHELVAGQSPSSTVALIRWDNLTLDALLLADSTIVVQHDEALKVLTDERIQHAKSAPRVIPSGRVGFGPDHDLFMSGVRAAELKSRNVAEGYWVAEATPDAAAYAVTYRCAISAVKAVLVLTDGAAAVVDRYTQCNDWQDALALASNAGVCMLLARVRAAEALDPNGILWPRSKPEDDATAVLLAFRGGEYSQGSI